MKTKVALLLPILLALTTDLIVVPAPGQGTQTLAWTGTTNRILALNVAHPLGATASSGLPVTLRVDSGPAVIANGAISVLGKGTVVVTAEQVGDAEYLPASETRHFNVRQMGFMPMGGFVTRGSAVAVDVVGSYAYVADSGTWDGSKYVGAELLVIDVSDPAHPMRAGRYTNNPTTNYEAAEVQVVGNYAYVTGQGRLQVIDVSTPSSPMQVGVFTNGYYSQVVGNSAFALVGERRFEILDVSNPTNLVSVGGWDVTCDSASTVQVKGHYAYVGGGWSGDAGRGSFEVFDVSNPTNPVQVAAIYTRGGVSALQVVGDFAYLAEGTTSEGGGYPGLEVIHLRSPTNPLPVAQVELGRGKGVRLVGEYAYVIGGGFRGSFPGFKVIDVSNPINPLLVGEYVTSRSRDAQVVGNHIYVADGEAGLQILEIKLGYPQALEFQVPAEVPFPARPIILPATTTSGLPLTFSVLDGPARIVNNQLVLTGLGVVTLYAEQAGDANFLPVSAQWSFAVTPPRLEARRAGGQLELVWPVGIAGLRLQVTESLGPQSQWQDVTAVPIEADGEASIRFDQAAPRGFFRLFKP